MVSTAILPGCDSSGPEPGTVAEPTEPPEEDPVVYSLDLIVEGGEGNLEVELESGEKTEEGYTPGSRLEITAQPTEASVFRGWEGIEDGEYWTRADVIRVTVDRNRTITAKFLDVTKVSGIIRSDETWTKESSPYYPDGELQIAEEATLRIEEGVEVVHGWTTPGVRPEIKYYGSLEIAGTEEERVVVEVRVGAALDAMGTLHVKYTDFIGISPSLGNSGDNTYTIEHSFFQGPVSLSGDGVFRKNVVHRTIFSFRHDNYRMPEEGAVIENNLFVIGENPDPYREGYVRFRGARDTIDTIRGNTFMPAGSRAVSYCCRRDSTLDLSGNYWSTNDEAVIEDMIYSSQDDLEYGEVNFKPFLAAPKPDTPILPDSLE
jgi:hypothetical protein